MYHTQFATLGEPADLARRMRSGEHRKLTSSSSSTVITLVSVLVTLMYNVGLAGA